MCVVMVCKSSIAQNDVRVVRPFDRYRLILGKQIFEVVGRQVSRVHWWVEKCVQFAL